VICSAVAHGRHLAQCLPPASRPQTPSGGSRVRPAARLRANSLSRTASPLMIFAKYHAGPADHRELPPQLPRERVCWFVRFCLLQDSCVFLIFTTRVDPNKWINFGEIDSFRKLSSFFQFLRQESGNTFWNTFCSGGLSARPTTDILFGPTTEINRNQTDNVIQLGFEG
jgi:hypothetical protein